MQLDRHRIGEDRCQVIGRAPGQRLRDPEGENDNATPFPDVPQSHPCSCSRLAVLNGVRGLIIPEPPTRCRQAKCRWSEIREGYCPTPTGKTRRRISASPPSSTEV